jgi:hypothetical protein
MTRQASIPAGPDPSARWRRPGAAAVGWGLLFFVCLQVALAIPMEHWRPDLRDLEYGYKVARLRARRADQPGRPLLAVLGSSRANHGFRPDALPPLPAVRPPRGGDPRPPVVFNAALMGSGPILELLCLHRLLADGVRPDWVLLECWPPFLYQDGERAEIYKIPVARLGWDDLAVLAPYYPDRCGLYQDWCLARVMPWSSSRFTLLTQFARDGLPREGRRDDQWVFIDGSGWLPYRHATDPVHVQARLPRVRDLFRPALEHGRPSADSDRALREAIALCRREGIAVGLLYMPEAPVFRGWYAPAARAEADAYLRRLSRECRVPLLDARTWRPDEDFADGIHLTPAGAAAFTEQCGRELLPGFLQAARGTALPSRPAGETARESRPAGETARESRPTE